jgi:hypothetical protein
VQSGAVAVNGVPDLNTNSVIELVYFNGSVWQENSGYLTWWYKTKPSDVWAPPTGTKVAPCVSYLMLLFFFTSFPIRSPLLLRNFFCFFVFDTLAHPLALTSRAPPAARSPTAPGTSG